jgi:hypothetical protein
MAGRLNKEPQNQEVFTSIFDIPCSIFCGLKNLIKPHYLYCPSGLGYGHRVEIP